MRIKQTKIIFQIQQKLREQVRHLDFMRKKYNLTHTDNMLFSDAGTSFADYPYTKGYTVNEVKKLIKDIDYLLSVDSGFSTEELYKPTNYEMLKVLLQRNKEMSFKIIEMHKARTEYNKSIRKSARNTIKGIDVWLEQLEDIEFLNKLPEKANYKNFEDLENEEELQIPNMNIKLNS